VFATPREVEVRTDGTDGEPLIDSFRRRPEQESENSYGVRKRGLC